MQERILTFTIFLLKRSRLIISETAPLRSYKKYQQKAYQQFAVAQGLVGEDQKDHAKEQKLLKSYVTAEKTAESRERGRTVFRMMTVPVRADRYGAFPMLLLLFGSTLRFSSFLTRRHLRRTYGWFAARRKGRKRISAVIARELHGYLFSAVSLLS